MIEIIVQLLNWVTFYNLHAELSRLNLFNNKILLHFILYSRMSTIGLREAITKMKF